MKDNLSKYETNNHALSIRDIFQLKDLSEPEVSPDEKYIIYTVTIADLKQNDRSDHIALVDLENNKVRLLASGNTAHWSPNGKKIAYRGEQDDNAGILIYDLETEQSTFLTPVYTSNYFMGHRAEKNFAWSPDGKKIAFLSTTPYSHSREEENVRIFNHLLYKTKGGHGRPYYSDQRLTHIWIVPARGGEPELVTPGNYNEHSISWSPDSGHITFISNRSSNQDYNHLNDIWKVNINTKEITRLTNDKGTEFNPKWAPDGSRIAFLSTTSAVNTKDSQADDTHLYVMASNGDGPRCLTKMLDRRIENIAWHPSGKFIYFTAGDKGCTGIYSVSLDDNTIETVINGAFHILEYSLFASGRKIACIQTDTTHPSELFLYENNTKSKSRITNHNTSLTRESNFQDAEMFWFKSFDQTEVQGWLIKPSAFDASETYPLILVIHGGPHNMFGYEFEARMQLLASQGYGVLFINPRGSSGYGQAFSRGCLLNWGGGDYNDLMHGVDHVINYYDWVDEDSLGVTGQSYGGYMTNWIITQTDRFKAAVVDGGISNLISFTGTSLYHLLLESEFNGRPWENYPLLWQWSPLRNVKNVTTPTLFLHGETDNEVPASQAEEMYTVLKKRGVETTFIHYIGEGHGWRPDLKPENRYDLYKRTISWFDTHIK